jgi:NAD(P)-dependent dehydrogenase (short-subunit alcohol dehydrogenase family)
VKQANRVVVLGALSAVGEAVCRLYAAEGAALLIAGRDGVRLQQVAADLRIRGAADVQIETMDLDAVSPAKAFPELAARLGGVDHVLIAYGVLGDQARAETDEQHASNLLSTNFLSPALWCLAAAEILERQRSGVLLAIGSVAGDRGRQSNYVYGAAKGGLGILLQGLAHRLAASGARAVIVKPGFIDTPMTAHLDKGGPLWAKADTVARIIRRAADSGGPVIYAPWFWRFILQIIRLVPAPIFHKTKL